MTLPGKCGHGTWFKMIWDPDGMARFYGFLSKTSLSYDSNLTNWLPGTRFQAYTNGKESGIFEVVYGEYGNALVEVDTQPIQ